MASSPASWLQLVSATAAGPPKGFLCAQPLEGFWLVGGSTFRVDVCHQSVAVGGTLMGRIFLPLWPAKRLAAQMACTLACVAVFPSLLTGVTLE